MGKGSAFLMPITESKARKILGNKYKNISNSELQEVLTSFYSLAEIVAETIKNRGSNISSVDVDSRIRKEQNGTE